MTDETRLEKLVEKVRANRKYQYISIDLIRRLSQDALAKGLAGKSAVKSVRNKLHQVGGAYFTRQLDLSQSNAAIHQLPKNFQAQETQQFCLQTMQSHASTAERIPILNAFFRTCLEPIAPVTNLIDLACGLNPLSIPWMPLANGFSYQACDIYLDMLLLLNTFFTHHNLDANAESCDLLGKLPETDAQVALLLKTIPCLEQVDKTIGIRLLDSIQAAHVLVSFPVRSLGGRKKGMPGFYRDHFYEITSGKNWGIQEFVFSTELAFLVTK